MIEYDRLSKWSEIKLELYKKSYNYLGKDKYNQLILDTVHEIIIELEKISKDEIVDNNFLKNDPQKNLIFEILDDFFYENSYNKFVSPNEIGNKQIIEEALSLIGKQLNNEDYEYSSQKEYLKREENINSNTEINTNELGTNKIDIKKLKKHVSIATLTHNRVMNELNKFNIFIWKDFKNSLFYRIESYGEKQKINKIRLSNYLYTVLKRSIIIYDTTEDIEINTDDYIVITLLPIVEMEIFDPYNKIEFIPYGNFSYKNTFEYTSYLLIRESLYEPKDTLKSIIYDFLKYLLQDDSYFNYIMNWLSFYFRKLNKSKYALVLIGDKKATEDILIDLIIKPIFAQKSKYFSTISDDTIEKETDEIILKDKIFYHAKEVTKKRNIDKASELVRKIISQQNFNHLEAYKKEEIYTFGQLIVTALNQNPFSYLKDIISRSIVLKTSDLDYILDKLDIDRITLEEKIQNDLGNFSEILLTYNATISYSDYVYNTKEKQLLIEDKISLINEEPIPYELIDDFIKYILNHKKYINRFDPIKKESLLYDELIHNFEENMIARQLLSTYFNLIFQVYKFENNEKLLNILKEKDKFFEQNIDYNKQYNRKKRYLLPEQKDLNITIKRLRVKFKKLKKVSDEKEKIDYTKNYASQKLTQKKSIYNKNKKSLSIQNQNKNINISNIKLFSKNKSKRK